MPKKAFTDRWLKTVKADKLKEEYIDSTFSEKGSFGVVVSRTGSKSFFHRYRVDGKKRRDILGSYPSLSLAAARQKAIDNVSQLNKGTDPSALKDEYRKAETFAELVELFFSRSEERLAPETLKNYRKMYKVDLDRPWGGRKAVDIKKADVIQVLEHICYERNAPTMSNRTYELIRRIFNFGISRDILQINPVQGLEKLAPEKRGERVFSHEEMKLFWSATEKLRPHIRVIFRLLLLIGQRPGEIRCIEWSHIDNDILTIPSANSKNRRKHQVHLTKTALSELARMKDISGNQQFVFAVGSSPEPIQYLNKGHLGIVAQMEKELEEINKTKAGKEANGGVDSIPWWTPRDLRRTVQTRMAEMGVRPDVVDRVLNHNVAGVRRHYDHYSYYPEIKKALVRWDQRLSEIVSGKGKGKVISIR